MLKRYDEVLPQADPGPRLAPRSCTSGTPSTTSDLTTRPGPRPFRLEFDDGSVVAVRGRGFIGRDPAPDGGDNVEHLITLADDTLSLSRTHLEFGIGESGLWIRDRFSTNGSDIEMNGCRIPVKPGTHVPAPVGCTIHLGARQVKVRTVPGRAVIGAATIDWGVATHTGRAHDRNEDAYCTEAPVFVVADGIGGHCAGDVASREAIGALMPLAAQVRVTGEMLSACLPDARARIDRIGVDHGRPPGTTLSGVIATHVDEVPSWLVVNIGDSRTYRLNSTEFRQLSVDHTVVQELIGAGAIAPSAASSHPARNLLTRALLGGIDYQADIWLLPMSAGDRVLVCSDGLTKEVEDDSIAAVLRTKSDPQVAADALIGAAVDAGGHDDVTALVVDVIAIRVPAGATRAHTT
jgi:serine/threonine protein phosphatase PrpC